MEKNQQGRIKKIDLLSILKRDETEKEEETETETKTKKMLKTLIFGILIIKIKNDFCYLKTKDNIKIK